MGPGGCAVRAAPSQLLLRGGQRCWHSLGEKAPATLPCCYDSWMFQRSVRCLWWTMATSIYSDSGLEQIPGLVLFSKLLLEIWSVKQTKPPDTLAVCAGRDFFLFSLGAHGVAEVLPLLCLVCILKHPFLCGQRALPSQYLCFSCWRNSVYGHPYLLPPWSSCKVDIELRATPSCVTAPSLTGSYFC